MRRGRPKKCMGEWDIKEYEVVYGDRGYDF